MDDVENIFGSSKILKWWGFLITYMIKDLEYRTGLRENFDDYLSNYFENSYNAKGMVESLKRGATYRPRIHSQYNSAPARCKTYTRKSFLLALYFFFQWPAREPNKGYISIRRVRKYNQLYIFVRQMLQKTVFTLFKKTHCTIAQSVDCRTFLPFLFR